MFSLQEVEDALPANMQGRMTAEVVNTLNTVITDPEFAETVKDNLISYTSVLTGRKFKLTSYIDAVIFVSFKLMGYKDKECYQRTFPKKYSDLVARNCSSKDIAAYVAAYTKNQLVNLIYEQTMIPIYVLNQSAVQQAINTQVELMTTSNSDKVRTDAANSILNHLKKPEAAQLKVDITTDGTGSEVDDLKRQMASLVANQKQMIEQGITTKQVAHQGLDGSFVEAECVEVTPDAD